MTVVSIAQAVDLLAGGQLVGIPTDTVYGLAVDPQNRQAIDRLFALKGRSPDKPLALLVSDLAHLADWVDIPDWAVDLLDAHWPGALTVVGSAGRLIPEGVGDPVRKTVGVRVPDHPVAQEILWQTGPLAVTSANLTGLPDCHSHEAANELLGDAVAGYVAGAAPVGMASTVVDVTGTEPVILRQGPVKL